MAVKGVVYERDPIKYGTIMGVDSSSLGVAWVVLRYGVMIGQGKINLQKIKGMNDKLKIIHEEWVNLLLEYLPSHVFIEKSIFVANPGTARTLSYIVGAIMCLSIGEGYEITDVEPATWKSFLGYKNLRSKFTKSVAEVMGRIEGKKYCDKLRKSQTWRVIQHNFPQQTEGSEAEYDHDIADAWGIALYGVNLLSHELLLEKTKDITLDLGELDRLGLAL